MFRSNRRVFGVATVLATFAVSMIPSPAHADDPVCPAADNASFTSLTRTIVPVGAPVMRAFQVDTITATNVQLLLPPGYTGSPFAVNRDRGFGLQITAPQAGQFALQATWTQTYLDASDVRVPCTGSGSVTLNATAGTPLKLTPPKRYRYPRVVHAPKGLPPQFTDLLWSYKCTVDSDPMPLEVQVRYEIRRSGRLSKHAPSIIAKAEDPCDRSLSGSIVKKLPHRAKLTAVVAGDFGAGGGAVVVEFTKSRYLKIKGKLAALHIAIAIKQGTKTLAKRKFCTNGVGDWVYDDRRASIC